MEVNASKEYNSVPLTEERTPKLLGVTFNCHPGFQHLCALVKRATLSQLVKLRAIGDNVHGGYWQALRAFHLALVEAPLTYALPVLCGPCAPSCWDDLTTVQAGDNENLSEESAEAHLLPLKTRAELQVFFFCISSTAASEAARGRS